MTACERDPEDIGTPKNAYIRIRESKEAARNKKRDELLFNNAIQVSVTVQNGNLSEIRITRQEEKRCFNALQLLPAQILKQHSLQVDGVTGATVTSLAIKNAVRDAVRKAQQ